MSKFQVFAGRAWRNVNRRISRLYLSWTFPKGSAPLTRLGSDANGWYAPEDPAPGMLSYCIGVGYDASFDFDLAARGAEVHSFDPTPHAVGYMERENKGRVTFHPWGAYDEDTTIRLYFPKSESHGSYFAEDLHNTGKYHEVPVYRIATIMEKLGHDRIDLMKMDIEGSWYQALADMLGDDITPGILEVEFDSPAPVWRVRRIAMLLRKAGYKLVLQDGDNCVFQLPQV